MGAIDSNGNMSAQLRGYPLDHPFASLTGSDNIVSFQTARYNSQPMIVRGPGAGPEVTAGGVFSTCSGLLHSWAHRNQHGVASQLLMRSASSGRNVVGRASGAARFANHAHRAVCVSRVDQDRRRPLQFRVELTRLPSATGWSSSVDSAW